MIKISKIVRNISQFLSQESKLKSNEYTVVDMMVVTVICLYVISTWKEKTSNFDLGKYKSK